MVTIEELLSSSCDAVAAQPIRWRRQNWAELWSDQGSLPGGEVLDLIDAEVNGEGDGTIRRSWVRSLADGDPLVFLTACTIWGFGNYVRRGRPALAAMLRTRNAVAITRQIVDAARVDPAAGFVELFDERGRTRIARLGIAFGTKVVHFAGYDYARPRPLVLDARVFRASQELDPRPPVPNPARYTTGAQYRAYCEWADEAARSNGVEPELIEYALFVRGGA